jgi:hypothetical protein
VRRFTPGVRSCRAGSGRSCAHQVPHQQKETQDEQQDHDQQEQVPPLPRPRDQPPGPVHGADRVGPGSKGQHRLKSDVNGSVRTVDLRDSAVNSAEVADTSITAPSEYGVEMTSNAPSGNGWFYAASNKTAATRTITVYALCLS